MGGQFQLAHRRRQIQLARKPQLGRHHREELFERCDPDRFEHRLLVGWCIGNIGHRARFAEHEW